ncbi:MAG: ribonuclease, partial [Frankiaceae bacterium]|nr:ribonuclease [Frankiaceae bacterium]
MVDDSTVDGTTGPTTPAEPPAKKTARKRATKAAPEVETTLEEVTAGSGADAPAKRPARKRTTKKTAAAAEGAGTPGGDSSGGATSTGAETTTGGGATAAGAPAIPTVIFQAPVLPDEPPAPRKRAPKKTAAPARPRGDSADAEAEPATDSSGAGGLDLDEPGSSEPAAPSAARRRRGRRGGRGRGAAGADGENGEQQDGDAEDDGGSAARPAGGRPARPAGGRPARRNVAESETADGEADDAEGDDDGDDESGTGTRRRRRRRRRRTGEGGPETTVDEDGVETVVHVREPRPKKQAAPSSDDDVRGVKGSTRLEAKRQRRREGRDSGRRRPPIITESEFLARRESVERIMVVRQGEDRTQIAVLEDGVLVEHYVARKDHASMVGNVYLGKVQNVLPSMEAAFVDIGRGRNAVLYAGEVNYDASALEGRPPRIEQALKTGQSVLVQVTKDPIGHKGSRLTSQVSLPGRYMVYVPDGRLSGISRKLPDTERSRLKGILKRLMPEDAGVIIRTAAEGASEEELERDLRRLHAQWEDIDKKTQTASAPTLIYAEPDVVIRVIRDIFNEDFAKLVVQGADEWDTVDNYLRWVAPDLAERASRWTDGEDVFAAYRIDEQLAKALDRKVWLPSGGYLVIDRTEAMIVVDVNTGKFTGKGGNLEETVTKNNLEAAEEIVRQLRLRDLGGIIVIDFIDMVLESNRDLVLRRLMECLGRDRTRHQVAEVTSLGLVQMTRKRLGVGLAESVTDTTAGPEPKQEQGRRRRGPAGGGATPPAAPKASTTHAITDGMKNALAQ